MKPQIGDKVGKLTVIEITHGRVKCRCECGIVVMRSYTNLVPGTMCGDCRRKAGHPFRGKWRIKP